MKKLFYLAVAVAFFASCGNSGSSTKQSEAATASEETMAVVYPLDDLLASAEDLVDQVVTVRGYVTHTCKHSGKRCFIVGESQNASMRVEAKGNIGGFNRELIGSQLEITGSLRENRLSREYIDQMEKDVNAKKIAEDGSAETCEAELANIESMKAWMKDNGKDYYSIYYMNGDDYTIVEE